MMMCYMTNNKAMYIMARSKMYETSYFIEFYLCLSENMFIMKKKKINNKYIKKFLKKRK